jgi:hypothetical protein
MVERVPPQDRSEAKTQFHTALKKDDFETQYELLTRGTRDVAIADTLVRVIQEDLKADESPQSIDWKTIRNRVRRTNWTHWIMPPITYSPNFAGRSWTIALTMLVATSAVASALLVRDAFDFQVTDPTFRGSIFLAVVFLGLAVLSALALVEQQFHQFSGRRREPASQRKEFVKMLPIGIVGAAAVAMVVLAVIWTLGGFSRDIREITILPNTPRILKISRIQSGTLVVTASDPDAEIVLRLIDAHGKEIKRSAGTEVVRVILRKDQPRAVTAEVASSERTRIAVVAFPSEN